MQEFVNEFMPGVHYALAIAMIIVMALIVVVSIFAFFVWIFLGIAYFRYNHKNNSAQMTGEQIARKVLDDNGLSNIAVTATGSVMFGNSYSHYFKKVRLRRFTYKKTSVSSMAMAVQKSSLAVLDKENDPDMKRRVKLVPIITFGPLAFVPIVVIGGALDYFIFNQTGVCTIIAAVVGVLFYLYSFILSIKVLKTEKKAQTRALDIMKNEGIATDEEIKMSKKLFRLYNIEYVNDMILSLLELIYRVLQIVMLFTNNSGNSGSSASNN